VNGIHEVSGSIPLGSTSLRCHAADAAAPKPRAKPGTRGGSYLAFPDESQAIAFERYLKTVSGRAFAKKRL
jgi:hypothetical protein